MKIKEKRDLEIQFNYQALITTYMWRESPY